MNNDKLWVKVLKWALGIIVAVALVGLGLYYTAKFDTYRPGTGQSGYDWGISKDSPIRSNR